MPMKSTPVGPVAGGIMGCFLVLALGVYCYRHHIHRSSHQYINNLPENQNRMSHFYEEEPPEPADDIAAGLWCYSIIFCHLNTWYVRNATNKKIHGICSCVSYFIVVVFHPSDFICLQDKTLFYLVKILLFIFYFYYAISGHTNFVLSTFENPASISPYRVNTSYRRPAGGDSDHGYSTMTPHEDSEHASLPCLEPLIKERYKPGSLSVVKNTPGKIPPPPSHYRRSRSPTPPKYYQPIPEQTIIPPQTTIIEHPSSVIANVQVHMVDTH